jgi:hypothetical protein
MPLNKLKILALIAVMSILGLSTLTSAQTATCYTELKDEVKGMGAVMENCKNIGTFSVGGRYGGQWQKLTYFYPQPWKGTYLTIRVGGKYYTNSIEAKDGILMDQYVTEQPSVVGNKLSVKWMLPDQIEVEEALELIQNYTLIHITIKNQNQNQDFNVGARILLDTMLGDNDGAPIYIPGEGLRESENTYAQAKNLNFRYWKAYNKIDSPTIVATGILDEGGKTTYPDSFKMADWKKSVVTAWDYRTDEITSILGDSAVLLYFDAQKLEPGSVREIITGYGSGEPVLTKITEITEIVLNNMTGQYCMGEEARIKVDTGSRINFIGSLRLEITNKLNDSVYLRTTPNLGIDAETVKSTENIFSIPENIKDENYTIIAVLLNQEGKQIDERTASFSVNAARCGITEPSAGPNWLLIAFLVLIILAILALIAFRNKGELRVTKIKNGEEVIVTVYNNSEKTFKKAVLEDRIVEGSEVDIKTLNVKRRGTRLHLDVGVLNPGKRITLEYKVKNVNVVPKAIFRWEDGEKSSK